MPAAAGVVVVVPPPLVPDELLLELPPQPTAVRAATEKTTAISAPQRRRRGKVINNMQARVAPDPTAYHGVLLAGVECGALTAAVVFTYAVMTKEVVTPAVELITTGVTVKEVVALIGLLGVAIRLIDPVNPLTGVRVKVVPGETPPGSAVVDAVQGVREKSFCVLETMSTEASVPSAGLRTAPLEPAYVPSPEYTALMPCPPERVAGKVSV